MFHKQQLERSSFYRQLCSIPLLTVSVPPKALWWGQISLLQNFGGLKSASVCKGSVLRQILGFPSLIVFTAMLTRQFFTFRVALPFSTENHRVRKKRWSGGLPLPSSTEKHLISKKKRVL